MPAPIQSPNPSKRKPTQAELLALFGYDPSTGLLVWKYRGPGPGLHNTGKTAGCLRKDGYVHVMIGGKSYYAHCLIWCLVKGEWPSIQIDHENLVRSDNKWLNLRLATPSQNKANIRARNKLDAKGIELFASGKYRARIRVRGKNYHLGMYDDLDGAKAAYFAAALEHFGEFARQS